MFHYAYIITNLITGKQYVGDRSCNCLPKEDPYLGSGIYLNRSQRKYGKENFRKEILELFETKKEAYNAQKKYIDEYNTLVPEGYNIDKNGGSRPTSEEINRKIGLGNKGKKLSEKHKKQISKANKDKKFSENHKEKIRESHLGKPHPHKGHKISKETKEKIRIGNLGKSGWNKGIPMSEKSKNKLSNSQKGNLYRLGTNHTEESKIKISKANKGKLAPNKGIKHSEGAKEKMKGKRISISGENNPMYGKTVPTKKCPHCGTIMDIRNYSRYHGEKCKLSP